MKAGLRQRLKNSLLFYLVASLLLLLKALPLVALGPVSRALGWLGWRLGRPERSRALANLKLALPQLPEKQRQALARRMFDQLSLSALECVAMGRLRRRLASEDSPVAFAPGAREALAQAGAAGKGVVFVTAHLGNWELMAAAVVRLAPVAVLYKPSYDARFTRIIERFRQESGIVGISVADSGHLFQAVRWLRQGKVLGVLLDQPAQQGLPLPFFAQLARTSRLPATLVQRLGCALVVGTTARQGPCQHAIYIRQIRPAGGPLALEETTRRLNQALEAAIARTPEQWVWSLDRWRSADQLQMSSVNAICVPQGKD